ncbi:MAG TPA: DUF1592 domain-containing protein [Polyangiaceae bacterium]|nr:DUF1592 domain-containing protein [Polyangiaceae bacterium]
MTKVEKRSILGGVFRCTAGAAFAAGALFAAGCSSSGDAPGASGANNNLGNTGGSAAMGVGGSTVVGAGGSTTVVGAGGAGDPPPTMPGDPGRVGLHRLNNHEYNNTVRDVMGDTTAPATDFLAEEGLSGFDNTAVSLGMTSGQFEKYFNAAGALVTNAFANPAWVAANIPCTAAAASDACVGTVLNGLGMHIYRRPLTDAEKTAAMGVYNADFTRASDGTAAMKEMIRAMLSAASFLYRAEVPTDPASAGPQALNGYEMASRLSYLHWSTAPDETLYQLAAGGGLADTATLEMQVDRMLDDAKGAEFNSNFGGQWLDIRKLGQHSVTATIFPTFSEPLRAAMETEGYMWFQEFVQGNRPITDWFTADFNYVNGALAQHYGYTLPAGADPNAFTKMEVPGDARSGFMGLAHFLTDTSFPGRTSPTKRAVWVLENLMCTPPPQPPPNVPKLEATAEPNSGSVDPATIVNVKARLEAHRQDPMCNSCHQLLDPLGLALENFDGIGAYRTAYSNGEAIDATGSFPVHAADGTTTAMPFTDAATLAALLASDARFTPCVSKQVFSYALGRVAGPSDDAYLAQINANWATRGGLTIRNLLKSVVTNDTFRFSRGEAP